MNRQQTWTGEVGWRVLLFVCLALATYAVEQLVELWWLPSLSADLAVRQLESSDAAAKSLRLYEMLRALLALASMTVVVMGGLVLFVPGLDKRVRHFRDEF